MNKIKFFGAPCVNKHSPRPADDRHVKPIQPAIEISEDERVRLAIRTMQETGERPMCGFY